MGDRMNWCWLTGHNWKIWKHRARSPLTREMEYWETTECSKCKKRRAIK